MPLENVTELSDDDPGPVPPAGSPAGPPADAPPADSAPAESTTAEPKAKPKARPKAKGAAKSKAKGKAAPKPAGKAKGKAKAKTVAKRPAAQGSDVNPVDGGSGETPSSSSTGPGSLKRPASAMAQPKVNKYIYRRDNVWGIKVDGREIIRAILSNISKFAIFMTVS